MPFQNIDPIWFLEPISFILLSVGLIVYWRLKRRFAVMMLLYSLIAYAGAIVLKEIVQAFTYRPLLNSAYGSNDVVLGLYFGLQTVFFEVGGAYLVAKIATSRGKMKAQDAESYGIGLGFWENGVLLGALTLVDLLADYAVLSLGSGSKAAQTVYNALVTAAPSYFYPPASALPLIGFAFMERVTSFLFHFSWGYLCVLAATFKKPVFFLIALPMGLLDFLVPFAGILGTAAFETIILALGIAVTFFTWQITDSVREQMRGSSTTNQPAGSGTTPAPTKRA